MGRRASSLLWLLLVERGSQRWRMSCLWPAPMREVQKKHALLVITVRPRPLVSWPGGSSKSIFQECWPIPLPVTTRMYGAARTGPLVGPPPVRTHPSPTVSPRAGHTHTAAPAHPASRLPGAPARAPTRRHRPSALPHARRPCACHSAAILALGRDVDDPRPSVRRGAVRHAPHAREVHRVPLVPARQ